MLVNLYRRCIALFAIDRFEEDKCIMEVNICIAFVIYFRHALHCLPDHTLCSLFIC